jgi:hypothetical protein
MRSYAVIFSVVVLAACSNLDDAELAERTTFIKIFNGIQGIEAAAAELTPDGYIVLGNMTITRDSVITVVFKTDLQGNFTTPIRYFQGGSGNSIKALPNNQGYLIVGEKIKTNPAATPTDNIDIISAHMLHISTELDSIKTIYLSDESSNEVKVDYRATAITLTPAGSVVILGTYHEALNLPERPFILLYNSTLTTVEWYTELESEVRSYRHAKSVHYTNGNIIWTSSIASEQQNFNYSWLSVVSLPEGSSVQTVDLMGATTEQTLQPNDMQAVPGIGFGIAGTRSNPDGSGANVFFARVDLIGKVVPFTIKYFDAYDGTTNETASQTQDYGTAITPTKDGGFILAGHFESSTTLNIGKGENDIFLIKVDPNGNLIWKKTLGGTGSETVSTIRETEDRGLLLCGTASLGEVPSIFLIKTDKIGELKD